MGGKTPQIFPFYVPLMWILGRECGRECGGGGIGAPAVFCPRPLCLLLCCFCTSSFPGQHHPGLPKNKQTKKKDGGKMSFAKWGDAPTAAPTLSQAELSQDAHVAALSIQSAPWPARMRPNGSPAAFSCIRSKSIKLGLHNPSQVSDKRNFPPSDFLGGPPHISNRRSEIFSCRAQAC